MSEFMQYRATQALLALAKQPYDLSQPGNLTPERIAQMTATACGYQLLYATQRASAEVVEALKDLAEESSAVHKMQKMQAGAVINKIEGFPSENRAVLHTAMRDFFAHPNNAETARKAASDAEKEHKKLKDFLHTVNRQGRFTQMISIGIGGSDLGPKALYLALERLSQNGRQVHFVSNIDPDDLALALRQVDLHKTLIVVVSKSGTTLETLTNETIIRDLITKKGMDPREQVVAITAQGSPMDDKSRYLECFYIWDSVGGRYSCTSMVGAVMLAFAFGHEVVWELLRGASAMDKVAMVEEIDHNLPLLLALFSVWNRNFLGCGTTAIIPYSQALCRFSAHIQQVEMESNGKTVDRYGHGLDFDTAPIIWGEAGTSAQHSFFQCIHQGSDIVPTEFIGFLESQCGLDQQVQGTTSQEKLLSNLIAQVIALAVGHKDENPNKSFSGNTPTLVVLGERLTPYALGSLVALYEHKAAFEGFIWGINSFDQEGVQLGKKIADKVIKQFAEERKGVDGRTIAESFPLGAAYIKLMREPRA